MTGKFNTKLEGMIMKIKGFKGMQYVDLKGIEKALGNNIDIMDSLNAIKRNHDTLENGFPLVYTTKVFMENPSLLALFNQSIVFTYGTTMCFPKESEVPPEIRLEFEASEGYDEGELKATINLQLKKSINTDSAEYKEHISFHRNEYENLIGEKIYYSNGRLAYDFQTIEDVIEYDTMRYEEMLFDSEGNVMVEMDVDFTSEEIEAIKNYFIKYCEKYENQEEWKTV